MKILMVDMSNIDEIPAGPDLDALIAETVMGWKDLGRGLFLAPEKERTQMIWGAELHEARKRLNITTDRIGDGFMWSPSTDIRCAWEVLETMHNGKSRFHWSVYSDNICDFSPFGPNDLPIYRTPRCESIPLAICRASLKAVEGEMR